MNRRSFISSILACAVAPAIVKAEILMPARGIVVPMGLTGWAEWNAQFMSDGWVTIPSVKQAMDFIEQHNRFTDKPYCLDPDSLKADVLENYLEPESSVTIMSREFLAVGSKGEFLEN